MHALRVPKPTTVLANMPIGVHSISPQPAADIRWIKVRFRHFSLCLICVVSSQVRHAGEVIVVDASSPVLAVVPPEAAASHIEYVTSGRAVRLPDW